MKNIYYGLYIMLVLPFAWLLPKTSEQYNAIDLKITCFAFGYEPTFDDWYHAIMSWIGIASILMILTGCTTITYEDGAAKFTRTSFGTQLQITELKATISDKGTRTIKIQGYSSDQAEGMKAVAEGVAAGVVAGFNPIK